MRTDKHGDALLIKKNIYSWNLASDHHNTDKQDCACLLNLTSLTRLSQTIMMRVLQFK